MCIFLSLRDVCMQYTKHALISASLSFLVCSAMRTAWMDGVYDAEVLHELNTAVDEVAALLRCRKALCDEGLKALLELLNSMKTHHVRL